MKRAWRGINLYIIIIIYYNYIVNIFFEYSNNISISVYVSISWVLKHLYIAENIPLNHILSNKVTVTALCKEGVRETFLFQSLMGPVVGKGNRTIPPPVLHSLLGKA